MLTLAAAAAYACYTITLKQMMPKDCESDMMRFFGYLGVLNVALFGPVVFIMQLSGSVDLFSISGRLLGMTLLKGAVLTCQACVHASACGTLVPAVKRRQLVSK